MQSPPHTHLQIFSLLCGSKPSERVGVAVRVQSSVREVLGLNLDREPAIMTENVSAFPRCLQAHITSRPPPPIISPRDNNGNHAQYGAPDRQHAAHMLAAIWKTEISANWVPGHPH